MIGQEGMAQVAEPGQKCAPVVQCSAGQAEAAAWLNHKRDALVQDFAFPGGFLQILSSSASDTGKKNCTLQE